MTSQQAAPPSEPPARRTTPRPDSELFDSPSEMQLLMEDYGLDENQVRNARGSGLV